MEAIKQLHANLIVSGLHRNPIHISKVLTFTALSPPHLPQALHIFNQIENPNTFIFNTLIRAFAPTDNPTESLLLYCRSKALGLKHDHFTFPFVLKACARIPSITEGQWIHADALKQGFISDVFISNALIHLYSSCKDFICARKVFDEMHMADLVSWNSLISGYGKEHRFKEVLGLFETMCAANVQADEVTMVNVISACTKLGEWDSANAAIMYLEENGIEIDVYLGNTLIDYYGRRGMSESACKVFDGLKEKNSMTMNAMIMTYAKGGDLVAAKEVFDTMPDRDLVSWSSMITGYVQLNNFSKALELFMQMIKAMIKPDEIVVTSLLSACSHLIAHNPGRSIHAYIHRNNIKSDIFVGNSLIDMYSKCGYISVAYKVFNQMREKDTTTWNLIILGLATDEHAETALQVFSDMLKREFKPDEMTFLGVLIACMHSGLVDEGLEFFNSMRGVHGVEPRIKHYGCIVDLLSRAGELDRAFEFIREMLMRPDAIVWRSLLGASKVHGNVLMAEYANKKLGELEPGNSGNYVLLSNAYAAAEKWNDAMKVRDKMKQTAVQKTPGCSSVEFSKSEVHSKSATL